MKGARKGATRKGAIREKASEEITRGMHLRAVFPALFMDDLPPRLNCDTFYTHP